MSLDLKHAPKDLLVKVWSLAILGIPVGLEELGTTGRVQIIASITFK